MSSVPQPDVVVCWNGLPVYAARCIAAAMGDPEVGKIVVLGTIPDVPLVGVERHLGARVRWIDPVTSRTWRSIGLSVPPLFVHTGWAYPAFNALADEVRAAGGRVITMVDNRYKGSLRQLIGAVYFRLRLRHKFSAAFVPGTSATRLLRFFGMESARIVSGLYGADPRIFVRGKPLRERSRRIGFVGRYVERKGVPELCAAWASVSGEHPDWELVCYGEGPLGRALERIPNCRTFPFGQPEQIAAALAGCRFLVLPSRDDHWGLVVHEAALCGCGLLVSNAVGASEDLVTDSNGRLFRPFDERSLAASFRWAFACDDSKLDGIESATAALSDRFGPVAWAAAFKKICAVARAAHN